MPSNKDAWDKLDILMKPLGGIIAGIAVAAIGYFGSQYLKDREVIDSNSRVFAEIISQRERADSDLRMNMFRSIIEKFFNNPSDRGQQVLSLELLAYNFNEALDLAPLFQRVNTDLRNDVKALRASATSGQASHDLQNAEDLVNRLERVAKEINIKQATTLAEEGFRVQGTVFLDELKDNPQGLTIIDKQQLDDRWFKVEVLDAYPDDKELRIKLTVYTKATNTGKATADSWNTADTMFNVGFFDYPMIDNTRLSNGKRAAVILQEWYGDVRSAEIQLIYFSGSRSSLKDKQYYDELLQDLLKLNTMRGAVR
jgi:hypothetical protein